ncbi:MAG: four helix bundle protein [Lentisphaeria bacterium]|nr:four helix bundle protein [Lentisphaeria bacterium]
MNEPAKLNHEKLLVYPLLLQFLAEANEHACGWGNIHAISDHYSRASEGILLSLAEASRSKQAGLKQTSVDCSLGSMLECAACFDIAVAKGIMNSLSCRNLKQRLATIYKMTVGLKKSWQEMELREDASAHMQSYVFLHEGLAAYKLGIQVIQELTVGGIAESLSRPHFRRIDEAATAIILHIAEGNGRFSDLDQARFLDMANQAVTKLSVRLDLCALKGEINDRIVPTIKGLLVRLAGATAKLAARKRGDTVTKVTYA